MNRLLIILMLSACSTNKYIVFYDKISNDFDRNSYFVAIRVQSPTDSGQFIIENDDLFYYLQQNQKVHKEQYQKLIKGKCIDKLPLQVNCALSSDFVKAFDVESVNANAQKGVDSFVNIYFLENTIKDGISKEERVAIIQKLFEWKIATKIDDETGFLTLETTKIKR